MAKCQSIIGVIIKTGVENNRLPACTSSIALPDLTQKDAQLVETEPGARGEPRRAFRGLCHTGAETLLRGAPRARTHAGGLWDPSKVYPLQARGVYFGSMILRTIVW